MTYAALTNERKKILMKKHFGLRRLLAALLALLLLLPSLTARVDATAKDVDPYEVQVTASDGLGVNMRSGPASTYDNVRSSPIPMGAILTVTKEETNSYGKLWGYVTYDGVSGWISMTEVTRISTQASEKTPASGTPEQMEQAYFGVLNNIVERYGIFRADRTEDGYYICDSELSSGGLTYAELIDFDGDGWPELYFLYVKAGAGGTEVVEELWYFTGEEAVCVLDSTSGTFRYDGNGHGNYLSYGSGYLEDFGELFLHISNAEYEPEERAYLYRNELYRFENGEMTQDSWDYFRQSESGSAAAGGIERDLTESVVTVREGTDCGLSWKVNDVEAVLKSLGGSIAAEHPTAQPEMQADPMEILGKIAYIGDRSRCRMDEDMAKAFAKVLEEQPYAYEWDAGMTLGALLVELSGDGYPVLVTLYRTYDNDWGENLCGNMTVWEYRDGTAAAYDFSEEFNYNGYGKPNGLGVYGGYFVASSSGGGGVDPIMGDCYYEIIGGRLVLRHTVTIYTPMDYPSDSKYTLDGKSCSDWDEAIGKLTDPPAHFKEKQTIVECGSDLFLRAEVTDAKTASSLLCAYAEAAAHSVAYPEITENDDRALVNSIAEAIAGDVGGEIRGIYKLADGVYYVIIVVDGEQKSAVVRGKRTSGAVSWIVDKVYDAPLASDELDAVTAAFHSKPNLTLDYGKIGGTLEETKTYLQEMLDNMDGVTPNDAAKSSLAAFIESAIAASCTDRVSAKDNRLEVTADTVKELAKQAKNTLREMDDLMADNGVSMNKTLTIMVRVVWNDVNRTEPCQITLDETVVDALDGCALQILLGDAHHYIRIDPDRLEKLIDQYGAVVIQISGGEDNVYTINFLDEDGEILEWIEAAVTVGLPAEDALSTIMASYAGGNDNWGGQYDPNAGVLSFETQYSGQYEVIRNGVEIGDIGDLSEEAQAAISFMVSKGYLALDGDCFRPGASLSRYEFTRALVGMFFALNRDLSTNFADVPADSEYYAYVASAQFRSIVEGFDDGTFGGDQNITMEQMLALAARTLIDLKGYGLPSDTQMLLASFSDCDQIKDWAKELVALAVREGMMDRGGMLAPQSDITREQAALILYRLFLLLYEVPPVVLELPEVTKDVGDGIGNSFTMPDFPVVIIGVVAVVSLTALIATACFLVSRRKRNN